MRQESFSLGQESGVDDYLNKQEFVHDWFMIGELKWIINGNEGDQY